MPRKPPDEMIAAGDAMPVDARPCDPIEALEVSLFMLLERVELVSVLGPLVLA